MLRWPPPIFRSTGPFLRFRFLMLAWGLGLILVALLGLLGCPPKPVTPVIPTPEGGLQDASPPAPLDAGAPLDGSVRFRGTNLSGAEFGSIVPGTPGLDYQYPDPSDIEYFRNVGMNHFRLPFRHERLQPKLQGPINEEEWERMAYVIDYATERGISVTLSPMNNFRHYGNVVSEVQIGDFWGRIAQRVKDNPRVSINPTNEPYGMPTEIVAALDTATIREARRVGFMGLILAPGNEYTGGGHWLQNYYGTPNANVMDIVGKDDSNVIFEVHQYLDINADGRGLDCVSTTIGPERLKGFVAWLRAKGRRAWLGEMAGKNTPMCAAAIKNLLSYVEANGDLFVGWDWWGAGVWSFATTYPFSIGPAIPAKPQLSWLIPFIPNGKIPQ